MHSLTQIVIASLLYCYVFGNEGKVYDLNDSNFKRTVMEDESIWFISFFAPWCGHCKRMEPEWTKAASEMKGKVKFGTIDGTVSQNLAAAYSVNSYPTIKIFDSGVKEANRAIQYESGRTASDFVAYAKDMFKRNEPAKPILQLLNNEQLVNLCADNQLCFVAFLPHILDCQSSCRKDILEVMRVMSEKYKQYDYGYTWVEGMSQPALEKEVGIGGFGYPAMIAINSRKMKFATHKGSFGMDSLNEFYRSFNGGRLRVSALAQMPKITLQEEWDGKDGAIPEMEDIDLSDVDFDDEPTEAKNEL